MKTIEYYLEDTINQLLEEALALKGKVDSEFDKGKLVGYYEAISKLLNQAEAFCISDKLSERVRNFNLESLLDKI